MKHATLHVASRAREELVDITADVARALGDAGVRDGLVTIFVAHTSAGVTINENADPDVQHDMLRWFASAVPNSPEFAHAEGNSDAHIKATLAGTSAQVICRDGQLLLGTWQGIYLCEFDGPRRRTLYLAVNEG